MRIVVRRVAFAAATVVALLVLSRANAPADSSEQHALDPAKSKAQFRIQHIFVEHVTGTIPIVSGTVTLSAGGVIPQAVSAVLDAGRVASGDRDRDAALESADYFDTQKFPTWTFVSSKITPSGAAAFSMDGSLTIHGVTQPEHLEVSVSGDAAHLVYHATGHIDRHAFGMKGARLDPVIGNVAEVTLDITLAR